MVPGVRRGVAAAGTVAGSGDGATVGWPDDARIEPAMLDAANRAFEQGSAVILAGAEGPGAQTRVIAAPLLVDGQALGGVALDVVMAGEQQQRAILQLLQWGAMWLGFVRQHEGSATASRLVTVVNIVASGLEHERFTASASAVVNELAVVLACERVSLGLRDRARVKLETLSNSARFSKNAKLVTGLEAAMDEAIDQDTTIAWSDTSTEAATDEAHVVRAHASLAEHGTTSACTVPLAHGGRAVGAITLERTEGEPFDSQTLELCEALTSILSPIFELKRKQDRPFFSRVADGIANGMGRLFGRGHLGLKAAAIGLSAVALFLGLVNADYRVTADARLESEVRRVVVAPRDGFIESASVRAGDRVTEGQTLGQLDKRDLELERTERVNQREQLIKEHREVLARRDRSRMRIVKAQIAQATAQAQLVEEQIARSSIAAPFDGVVIQGDLSQSVGSPVEQGQVLFEIAPNEINRVVLQVDERDISSVHEGQQGTLSLSALPGKTLAFVVRKLTPVSQPESGRNTFRVEAELQGADGALRPGMQGVGKMQVERRRLLWIWTHRAIDWLRLKLWALWP